ncbi:hypothetical protein PIB30_108069, partial [Stylosanthes scabra]|nr:hypothetical protein [Stylosanthes scabra]
RNHEETEEDEENRKQRKLESSYKEHKLIQGNIKVTHSKVTHSKVPRLPKFTLKSRLGLVHAKSQK